MVKMSYCECWNHVLLAFLQAFKKVWRQLQAVWNTDILQFQLKLKFTRFSFRLTCPEHNWMNASMVQSKLGKKISNKSKSTTFQLLLTLIHLKSNIFLTEHVREASQLFVPHSKLTTMATEVSIICHVNINKEIWGRLMRTFQGQLNSNFIFKSVWVFLKTGKNELQSLKVRRWLIKYELVHF